MMASLPSPARGQGGVYPALSAAVAALAFLALEITAWRHAGGVFAYPLDDVYIHMSMAESILQGGYGINPGEPASAASSILYPVLLLPLFGAAVQLWQPLVLNALGVLLCGALWGAGVARAGLSRMTALVFAIVGPLALNMAGLAYTGMEHSLHAAAALATVLGLWIFVTEGRIGALLILGTFFAPLFRLEGLALSGLVCSVLLLRGRIGAGFALGVATLAPVLAFMAFLHGLGLLWLPGSVIAKVNLIGAELGPLRRVLAQFLVNLLPVQGRVLAAGTLLCLVLPLLLPVLRRDGRGLFLLALGLAGLAHLLGGQIGWMHRYEIYILAALALGLLLVAGNLAGPVAETLKALLVLALGLVGLSFWTILGTSYIWNPRAVLLQQGQMARFVKEWWKAPVALNDLGLVAWQNPDYVLDLFGLGSPEALALRLAPHQPGWAEPLLRRHGVQLAMIYDDWLGRSLGPEAVRLGQLVLIERQAALGGYAVSFYATDPAAAPRLRGLLTDFAQTLPPGARWEPAP